MSDTSEPKVELEGDGKFALKIVGESHYQQNLKLICGGRRHEGVEEFRTAKLICEKDNPYDSQAVRIEVEEMTVGHLSRKNAREYRQQLVKAGNEGLAAICNAKITGGWDRGPSDRGKFSVRLDVPVKARRSSDFCCLIPALLVIVVTGAILVWAVTHFF